MGSDIWKGLTRDEVSNIIYQRIFDARTRQILRLKDLDGLTFDEVSEKTMLSDSAVKRRYYEAHDGLKMILLGHD